MTKSASAIVEGLGREVGYQINTFMAEYNKYVGIKYIVMCLINKFVYYCNFCVITDAFN